MKKTLAEAKEYFKNESVFEVGNEFLVNKFGKYMPNISFLIPMDFEKDPLEFRGDKPAQDMLRNMNMSWNGNPGVIFGNFWVSKKKGGACFRPLPPKAAKHILVRIDWGGCFDSTRGNYGGKEIGEIYFRRASSNGGGSGYDYWVFPVGFRRKCDEEGETKPSEISLADVGEIVRLFTNHDREQTAKAVAETEAKDQAEKSSRVAKARLEKRLIAVSDRLLVLKREPIELGETKFKYSRFLEEQLYTEKNIYDVEKDVTDIETEIKKEENLRLIRENFLPKFEVFLPRTKELGIRFLFGKEEISVSRVGYSVGSFSYSDDGLEGFIKFLNDEAKKVAEAKAKTESEAKYVVLKGEAEKLGLPKDIRIWCSRGGCTNAGDGWIINSAGLDREPTARFNENPRRLQRYGEGFKIWEQILEGEIVLSWSKACSADEHYFHVEHLPSTELTEAQKERIKEIQDSLQEEWKDARGFASGKLSPSVGKGWGLF
jgi:hypothetical protein